MQLKVKPLTTTEPTKIIYEFKQNAYESVLTFVITMKATKTSMPLIGDLFDNRRDYRHAIITKIDYNDSLVDIYVCIYDEPLIKDTWAILSELRHVNPDKLSFREFVMMAEYFDVMHQVPDFLMLAHKLGYDLPKTTHQ